MPTTTKAVAGRRETERAFNTDMRMPDPLYSPKQVSKLGSTNNKYVVLKGHLKDVERVISQARTPSSYNAVVAAFLVVSITR
jgi:hypothetical protein